MSHITISKFRKLFNLKVLEFDKRIPIIRNSACPLDDFEMTVLCRLTGDDPTLSIEIGCCGKCGYVGYIDKPAEDWISTFYVETWDGVKGRKIDREIQKRKQKYNVQNPEFERAVKVLDRWKDNFSKEKFLCDMGCGYGMQLKILREYGFEKLIGCEASPQRAEVARRAFGLHVLDGTFGHPSVQAKLHELAPIGLIYANNVFEHVYNPAEVVRLCAGLQEEGDKLVIAVPNQVGEPTWCTLLYFLHLSCFTPHALQMLLSRYGYEVVDSLNTPNEICVLAEKKRGATPVFSKEGSDFYGAARRKIISYFFPHNVRPVGKLFWCGRESDDSGYLPYFGNTIITRIMERMSEKKLMKKYQTKQSYYGIPDLPMKGNMLSLVIPTSHIPEDNAPFEIHFEGNIKLLYR